MNVWYRGVAAGVYIAIAAMANLFAITKGSVMLGAFIFPAGLMVICSAQYMLFTGMVRWLPDAKDHQYPVLLLQVLIANVIGVILISLISNNNLAIVNAAELICFNFINENWYIVLFKGILCGLCITAACYAWERDQWYITLLMVFIFVFCGMRHCIADAYYLSMCKMWAAGLLNWFCVIIGNVIGGALLPAIERITEN